MLVVVGMLMDMQTSKDVNSILRMRCIHGIPHLSAGVIPRGRGRTGGAIAREPPK